MATIVGVPNRLVIGDDSSRVTGTQTVTMPTEGWIDALNFGTVIATLQALGISLSAGDTVDVKLRTAPVKDDALGATLLSWTSVSSGQVSRSINRLEDTSNNVPLQRWLYWQLDIASGGSGGPWSANFEILAVLKTRS